MNEEQNGTIPDGSIVLQILNRVLSRFPILPKYMSGGLLVSDISALPFRNGFQ